MYGKRISKYFPYLKNNLPIGIKNTVTTRTRKKLYKNV